MPGKTESNIWPMPKFSFMVDWGNTLRNIAFQEISGLDEDVEVIRYRDNKKPKYYPVDMPGITKYSNVTLKRGVLEDSATFQTWYDQVKMGTIKRQTVTIRSVDQSGNTVKTWHLINAWPLKVTSTDLKSDGKDMALDSLEIAYERLETLP